VPLALQPMQLVGLMIQPKHNLCGPKRDRTVTLNALALAGGATRSP